MLIKIEVEHKDSSGGGGIIKTGDVQWMTAGATLYMKNFIQKLLKKVVYLKWFQLWVNLPAKDKMTPARYQAIDNSDIPVVNFADDAGQIRVIAGTCHDVKGPASTFSPINVWDGQLKAEKSEHIHAISWSQYLLLYLKVKC